MKHMKATNKVMVLSFSFFIGFDLSQGTDYCSDNMKKESGQ